MSGYQTAWRPTPTFQRGVPATPVVPIERVRPAPLPAQEPVVVEPEQQQPELSFCVGPADKVEPPRVQVIKRQVAEKHGVTIAELVSDHRFDRLCKARAEAYWRLRHETRWSLPQIARSFNRDHSTIHHALSRYGGA